jgi:hypothetical protein
MIDCLMHEGSNHVSLPIQAYKTNDVTIHGHRFRPGVTLSLKMCADMPQFAITESVYIVSILNFL